jgi:nicotinamidase/pyrazinamidase
VDVQSDFCPGGALPVAHADEIIPRLNAVIRSFARAGKPILFTRDWHPKNHCSFESEGGIWPPHCVRGRAGARFHPGLLVPPGATIISKGTKPEVEAYSGFEGTHLEERLRRLGVRELVVGGLATDYCVKRTVLDGLKDGLSVAVLSDCVKGVNVGKNDSAKAMKLMVKSGAVKISSAGIIRRVRAAGGSK